MNDRRRRFMLLVTAGHTTTDDLGCAPWCRQVNDAAHLPLPIAGAARAKIHYVSLFVANMPFVAHIAAAAVTYVLNYAISPIRKVVLFLPD